MTRGAGDTAPGGDAGVTWGPGREGEFFPAGASEDERLRARRTLALLHQGDARVFDQLVRAFSGRIRRYVRAIVSGHPQADLVAEDLTHDTFVRVFERARECRDAASFRSWMFRIARNLAHDRVRSRRIAARALTVARELFLRSRRGPLEPLEELSGAETKRAFERALARLSPDFRTAFLLREQEGLSYEEIAYVLGISPKTVSSRIHRARESLRDELRRHLGHGPRRRGGEP